MTPLSHSVRSRIFAMVLCSMLLGSTSAAQQSNEPQSLALCAASNDLTCMQLLLDHGADVNQLASFGASPLRMAIGYKNTEAALLLLANHANPNLTGTPEYMAADKNNTLLLIAVSQRDNALVQALLQAGANPNAANDSGATPLSYLITQRDPQLDTIFNLLLAAKADPNQRDLNGDTPFDYAVSTALNFPDPANKQRVKQLLAAGANPNLGMASSNIGLPLVRAADGEHGDKDLLALLLANGADPNIRDPLLLNNIHARRDLAELLIDNGLEVDLRNSDAATALDLAIDRDDLSQAKLLLSLGAGHLTAYPLAIAARKSDVEMVRLLLDYGDSPQSFVDPQKQLSAADFPDPTIRKLLQDRLTLQNSALEIVKRYPDNEAAMMKLIKDRAFAPADAQRINEYAAAAPTDRGLLVLNIIFSVGSGKNLPLPPEALQHEQAGTAAYAGATSRTQFLSAGNEFVQAARLAPWMPAYPRNACLLLMMGGAYAQAEPLCYAYKMVAPSDAAFDQLLAPYTQKEAALLLH